jgi:hypothetical protein
VVDLDGTLLRTDLLVESALHLIKQKPWFALLMPLWLFRGRAYLKHKIFRLIKLDASLLPPHEEVLAWRKTRRHAVDVWSSPQHPIITKRAW